MGKLKLDLDALSVDSFSTNNDHGRGDGTVRGESVDGYNTGATKFGTSCLYGSCWMTCTSCDTQAPIMGGCVLGACSHPECNPALTPDC
jgi:hypothetical protein